MAGFYPGLWTEHRILRSVGTVPRVWHRNHPYRERGIKVEGFYPVRIVMLIMLGEEKLAKNLWGIWEVLLERQFERDRADPLLMFSQAWLHNGVLSAVRAFCGGDDVFTGQRCGILIQAGFKLKEVLVLETWDAAAVLPTCKKQVAYCMRVWNAANPAVRRSRSQIPRHLARMVLKLGLSGDRAVLDRYAQWFRDQPWLDLRMRVPEVFAPFAEFPEHEELRKTAEWVFGSSESPWRPFIGKRSKYGTRGMRDLLPTRSRRCKTMGGAFARCHPVHVFANAATGRKFPSVFRTCFARHFLEKINRRLFVLVRHLHANALSTHEQMRSHTGTDRIGDKGLNSTHLKLQFQHFRFLQGSEIGYGCHFHKNYPRCRKTQAARRKDTAHRRLR